MKILAIGALFFMMLTCVQAAPHVWQSGFKMGFSEYKIDNGLGQHLRISCNTAAGQSYDHAVSFIDGNFEYQNTDSRTPLSFIFNENISVIPLGNTKWRNGANAWNTFKNNVSNANKIEVFLNSRKIATFSPSSASVRNVAKEIQGCEPLS